MATTSDIKREKILYAAAELFGQQGFSVSMDSIAKLADVSKQTVYSHFKTKDTLFAMCMHKRCEEYQISDSALDVEGDIDTVLLRFAIGFQSTLLMPEAVHMYRNAVRQVESHSEIAENYLQLGPEKATHALINYLNAKCKDGTISLPCSAHDAAVQLLLMFHGKAVYWRYLGGESKETEQQRKEYLKQCIAMFLTYVKAKQ